MPALPEHPGQCVQGLKCLPVPLMSVQLEGSQQVTGILWLWHTVFDGTWVCRCDFSQWLRELRESDPR